MLYGARNEINDPKKLGKSLSDKAKTQIREAIQNHVKWLENNQDLEAAEYKKRETEFEKFFRQIVEKSKQKSKTEGSEKDDKSEL